MATSIARRQRINRQNASHSTGPTSAEGRDRSSKNALKHGLHAKKHALDSEDPRKAQARARTWSRFYQPQSPAQQHALDQAVEATIMLDRCSLHLRDTLNRQVRQATQRWDNDRDDHVAALVALLQTDPAAAVRGLKRTAHGCRWLIAQWVDLLDALATDGTWGHDDCTTAIRLQGYDPQEVSHPIVFLCRAYNLLARDDPGRQLEGVLAQAPLSLRGRFDARRPEELPDCEGSRAWLIEQAEAELAELQPRAERLHEEYDAPDRAEAAGRALVPYDGPEARLFLRYRTTYESSYQKAWKGLKELEEAALEAGRGLLPNEANHPVHRSQVVVDSGCYGINFGEVSESAGAHEAVGVDEEPCDVAWGLDPADLCGEKAAAQDLRESCGGPSACSRQCAEGIGDSPLPPPLPERELLTPHRAAHKSDLPNEASDQIVATELLSIPITYINNFGVVTDSPAGVKDCGAGLGVPSPVETGALGEPGHRPTRARHA